MRARNGCAGIVAEGCPRAAQINTTKSASEIRHVYLKGARQLRPEWAYDEDEAAVS
ncbi:MAG: chorismate mutase [Thermomicrobiales bacterium]|nr:chorismate mutase [Thermomicrobiales bacterium]